MSRLVEQEAQKIISSAVYPAPVFEARLGWREDSVEFSLKDKVKFTYSGPFQSVKSNIYTSNTDRKPYIEIRTDVESLAHNIKTQIAEGICHFLDLHLGAKNIKLTSIYRFYRDLFQRNRIDEQLENDLFNIYVYMKEQDQLNSRITDHTKNTLKLLEYIQQRQEGKK
jgi:hypothetical protein